MRNHSRFQFPVLFAAITILLFVTGCDTSTQPSSAEAPPAFDMVAAKAAIEASNQKFMTAMSNGDAAAIAGFYTEDAKFMAPNAPAMAGRAAIQAGNEDGFKAGFTQLALTLIDLWGNEDMLVEEGTYTIGTKDEPIIDNGKYIVLWKKEDGQWKLHRDMYNSDLPVPSAD